MATSKRNRAAYMREYRAKKKEISATPPLEASGRFLRIRRPPLRIWCSHSKLKVPPGHPLRRGAFCSCLIMAVAFIS